MENTEYEKLALLSQGFYDKVYKTRNNNTDAECVMKIINIKRTGLKPFQNKVATMEKVNTLSSPYLVKYITSYVRKEELEYVIIMEYCNGEVQRIS